ncbi:ACP S-malonyltransferase [Paenibacillus sp. GSMTC-2017]|uniref:ACP S-malonyltransferase n=1 Tax=Paenibacillus sp. GSMTC-2017 TaxID=2794350 RepID=UPI0018D5ECDF|nr:ACP S-malonyltransferase [Paenibacillus sp. GSMTC-2017]MBH5318592.1 ACP S-malonyltransferase [Paenibacillus sp. GSMTC-2017]
MEKHALLFPGQGSQYVGMGKELCAAYPIARETIEEASEVLHINLTKLMFEGSMKELTRTEYAQPAILTLGMAMFRIYRDVTGRVPYYLAGHSLGEITALACSGGIPFASAVSIVHRRGELMRDAAALGGGAMAAVTGLMADDVHHICTIVSGSYNGGSETVVVSNINSEEQVVISGHKGALNEAAERLTELGGVVIPLQVSAPFHSPLMAPAAEQFAEELSKHTFAPFQYPVLSSVTGVPYGSTNDIAKILTQQLTAPVRWTTVIRYLLENGVSEAIELGPQSVLKKLAQGVTTLKVYSFDHAPDMELLIRGNKSREGEFSLDFIIQCMTIATSTRNRNWDTEAYTQGAVTPYRKLQKTLFELQQSGQNASWEQMEQAYFMLVSVLETKLVPKEERNNRLKRLLEENGVKQLFANSTIEGATMI